MSQERLINELFFLCRRIECISSDSAQECQYLVLEFLNYINKLELIFPDPFNNEFFPSLHTHYPFFDRLLFCIEWINQLPFNPFVRLRPDISSCSISPHSPHILRFVRIMLLAAHKRAFPALESTYGAVKQPQYLLARIIASTSHYIGSDTHVDRHHIAHDHPSSVRSSPLSLWSSGKRGSSGGYR
eukprot:gnl/Dysnectes_brevis/4238_a5610_1031.p1 GENE.gnl/Dysnectes_brevis/4238_a5610_1031~~gnl/Dysnectes_brevis/4238_a5610_1031.p1  ORF type:complete len:186 (+),score=3.16 gnl/Dysnectes_brevis/4238_a5610_1031:81-638(+)